jgi:hypothetical protein
MVKIPAFSRRGISSDSPERRARLGVALVFFGLTIPWFAWLMIRSESALRGGLFIDEGARDTWRLIALWMAIIRQGALLVALYGALTITRSGLPKNQKGRHLLSAAIGMTTLGQGATLYTFLDNLSVLPMDIFRLFSLVSVAAIIAFALLCGRLVVHARGGEFPVLASGVIALVIFNYVANWGIYAAPWANARISLLVSGGLSLLTLSLFAGLFVKTWRALGHEPENPS